MNDNILTDRLRAADPFAPTSVAPPARARDPQLLLDEVTVGPSGSGPARRPSARRPAILRHVPQLVAAAAVALVALGTIVVSPWSTPTATAEVVSVAQQTEAAGGGQVDGTISVAASPEGVSGTTTFSLRYSEGDFDLSLQDEDGDRRFVGVGDVLYTKDAGAPSFVRSDRAEDDEIETGTGVAAAGVGADGVVALLEQTEGVTATQTGDGATTYRGQVSRDQLVGLDQLPPGPSFLLGIEGRVEYPDTVEVTVEASGNRLERLVLGLVGETPAGRTDVTIVTSFSDPRPEPVIAAPGAADIQVDDGSCYGYASGDGGSVESAGCARLLEVVDEFAVQNPYHPCLQLPSSGDAAEQEQAFIGCLDEQGEPEVADAYRDYVAGVPVANR